MNRTQKEEAQFKFDALFIFFLCGKSDNPTEHLILEYYILQKNNFLHSGLVDLIWGPGDNFSPCHNFD